MHGVLSRGITSHVTLCHFEDDFYTPLCYNMNIRQPPLGLSQHKGLSVTKTHSAV